MPSPLSAEQALDRYFLDMRCKVLDVAAALDRLNRAENSGGGSGDARIQNLRNAVRVLLDNEPDRAERVQMIFSDPYQASWERPTSRTV